jgi:hypothetical protein
MPETPSGNSNDDGIIHTSDKDGVHNTHTRTRTFFIILNLAAITMNASVATGLITVGLPDITRNLELPEHLLLW